jgi:hypothetical protein
MSNMNAKAAIGQIAEKWVEARNKAHFYHGVSEQQFEFFNGLQNGYREAMFFVAEQFDVSRVEVREIMLNARDKAAA